MTESRSPHFSAADGVTGIIMFSQIAIAAFPPVPPALAEKYALGEIGLRPFGIEESDLAIDFSQSDTPELVTRILAQCAVAREADLPAEFFEDLTVGKRLECLLRLAEGGANRAFQLTFKCGSCVQELEFELTLDEIGEMQAEADRSETVEVTVGGERYVFRKPLGRDQKSWQTSVFADETAATRAMIGSLQTNPQTAEIGGGNFDLIAEALDESDPLVDFNCRIRCGDCGAVNDFPIDLSDFALRELSRAQQFLLRTVHRLAARYHWSEKEIFAVPHWRRMKYLALLADDKTK